jgi:hypothetical protein
LGVGLLRYVVMLFVFDSGFMLVWNGCCWQRFVNDVGDIFSVMLGKNLEFGELFVRLIHLSPPFPLILLLYL